MSASWPSTLSPEAIVAVSASSAAAINTSILVADVIDRIVVVFGERLGDFDLEGRRLPDRLIVFDGETCHQLNILPWGMRIFRSWWADPFRARNRRAEVAEDSPSVLLGQKDAG